MKTNFEKYSAVIAATVLSIGGATTALGQTTNAITILNPDFTLDTAVDGSYTSPTTDWGLATFSGSAINATLNRTSSPYTGQTGDQLGQIFALNYGFAGLLIQNTGAAWVNGDTYDLQADLYNPSGASVYLAIFDASTVVGLTAVGTQSGNVMQDIDVQYTANGTEDGTVQVGLYVTGQGAYTGIESDNYQLNQITPAPVPEPTTLALAAMGGFGMFTLIRRRRKS